MNNKIILTTINTDHGDYTTDLTIHDIKILKAAAEMSDDKLMSIHLASMEAKYKGEEMDSKTIRILDLSIVKIYGYTIHEMTRKEKKEKKTK